MGSSDEMTEPSESLRAIRNWRFFSDPVSIVPIARVSNRKPARFHEAFLELELEIDKLIFISKFVS